MHIVIFGTGGVGGYIGGRLAQAGNDVTFIARGEHLAAIRANGLQVKSIAGDFTVTPARATDRPAEIAGADIVLCCVKSWQVAGVVEQIRPLLGPETVVIPIQNGVEAHTILAEALGSGRVLPGLCKMICMIEAPGRIRHAGIEPYLAFGQPDGNIGSLVEKAETAFARVQGLSVEVSRHIIRELWLKFMIIAPWSGVGAVSRAPIGVFRSISQTRELLREAITEIFNVAWANGVDVTEESVEATMRFMDQAPAGGTASMQRDIMEGRPSELHEQCGTVVRFGEKAGVPTPVNRFIYHALLPQEAKARGEADF